MGSNERRERERQELREKILDAARELFVAEGYDAVTMRKIADKIEYSPTAIYAHFKDKETLIRALCESDLLTIAAEFLEVAQVADPIERLKQAGKVYYNFAIKHPQHYRLIFMTPWHDADHRRILDTEQLKDERFGNPRYDAYAFLRIAVAEAIEKGLMREELTDADLVAQTVWAGLHGVISLHLITKDCEDWIDWADPQRRVDLMIDTVFRGVARGGSGG